MGGPHIEHQLPAKRDHAAGGHDAELQADIDQALRLAGEVLGVDLPKKHILDLAHHWGATWVVVDATGVSTGLASFLRSTVKERVIPVTFSPKVKGELGWNFLAIVETGRYQYYAQGVGADDGKPDTHQFWYEVEACQ